MYTVFPTRICILGQPLDCDVAGNPGRERRREEKPDEPRAGWSCCRPRGSRRWCCWTWPGTRRVLGSTWALPREERDACPWKSLLSQRCHLLQPRTGLGCCSPFCCSITPRLAAARRKRHEELALDKSKPSEEEGWSSREGRPFFLVYVPRR